MKVNKSVSTFFSHLPILSQIIPKVLPGSKVQLFWEGHKDWEDFCGLLRKAELYCHFLAQTFKDDRSAKGLSRQPWHGNSKSFSLQTVFFSWLDMKRSEKPTCFSTGQKVQNVAMIFISCSLLSFISYFLSNLEFWKTGFINVHPFYSLDYDTLVNSVGG